MIVRTWKAEVSREHESEYAETVRRIVLPGLGSVSGYRGAHFLRRTLGDNVEILVLTYWESMEAVEALTQGRPATAYIPPGIAAILDRYDTTADHYTVMAEDGVMSNVERHTSNVKPGTWNVERP